MEIVGAGVEAALSLGTGIIFQPIVDLGDALLQQIVSFAVGEHCKRTGLVIRFHSLLSAGVHVEPMGKLYSLKAKVEVQVGSIWAVKIVVFQVYVSLFGKFELRAYEEVAIGA